MLEPSPIPPPSQRLKPRLVVLRQVEHNAPHRWAVCTPSTRPESQENARNRNESGREVNENEQIGGALGRGGQSWSDCGDTTRRADLHPLRWLVAGQPFCIMSSRVDARGGSTWSEGMELS